MSFMAASDQGRSGEPVQEMKIVNDVRSVCPPFEFSQGTSAVCWTPGFGRPSCASHSQATLHHSEEFEALSWVRDCWSSLAACCKVGG